jgi:hypothetical protein
MRRIPSLMFWILLGLAIVAVPIACSSSDTGNVDAHADGLTQT